MSDDEKPKEEEAPPEPSGGGEDMVAKAMNAAERLEKANAQLEKHLKALESRRVKDVLSGRSGAVSNESKEETPAEYAKRVMANEL